MRFLFLLFIIIPIIEITLLINVGQAIGAWYTIGLVVLSAFVGVNMLRYQSLSTLMRARSRMDSGEIPAQEMVEGLVLAVGGALLITPGFVTDIIGFCCLVPLTRHALVKPLLRQFAVSAARQGGAFVQYPPPERGPSSVDSGSVGSGSVDSDFVDLGTTESSFGRDRASRPDAGKAGGAKAGGIKAGEVIDGEYRRDD